MNKGFADFLAAADPDVICRTLKFPRWRFALYEAYFICLKAQRKQLLVLSMLDYEQVFLHVLTYNEPAFSAALLLTAYAAAAALSEGIVHQPVMPAYHPSG